MTPVESLAEGTQRIFKTWNKRVWVPEALWRAPVCPGFIDRCDLLVALSRQARS
jgi:hypothetical protein